MATLAGPEFSRAGMRIPHAPATSGDPTFRTRVVADVGDGRVDTQAETGHQHRGRLRLDNAFHAAVRSQEAGVQPSDGVGTLHCPLVAVSHDVIA